jgi:hypothetical protein
VGQETLKASLGWPAPVAIEQAGTPTKWCRPRADLLMQPQSIAIDTREKAEHD